MAKKDIKLKVPLIPPNQPPILAEAINSSDVKPPPPSKVDFSGAIGAPQIEEICRHVHSRLLIASLDEAWSTTGEGLGEFGAKDEAGNLRQPDVLSSGEEKWARAVTELLLGTAYGGPGLQYEMPGSGDVSRKDGRFFRKIQDGGDVYPIVLACQHLCDFGLASRGITFPNASSGTAKAGDLKDDSVSSLLGAADCTSQFAAIQPSGGEFIAAGKVLDANGNDQMRSIAKAVEKGFGPGGVYAFNDSAGGDQPEGAHIGFAVRVNRGRAQLFDTGAMNTREYRSGFGNGALIFEKGDGGNRDFSWTDAPPGPTVAGPPDASGKATRRPIAFRGIGIPPKRTDAELSAAAAKLLTLRPLGLARLVISPLGKFDVLFATPLLPMWHDEAGKSFNFPVSRYLWSLRHLPGREQVTARWIISIPIRGFAQRMLESTRGETLKTMLEDVGLASQPVLKPRGFVRDPKGEIATILHLSTVAGAANYDQGTDKNNVTEGRVAIVRRMKDGSFRGVERNPSQKDLQKLEQLPWNDAGGTVKLSDFSKLSYFKPSI